MKTIQKFFSENGLYHPFWPNERTILETILKRSENDGEKNRYKDVYKVNILLNDFFNKSGGFKLTQPSFHLNKRICEDDEVCELWNDIFDSFSFQYNTISKVIHCRCCLEDFKELKIQERLFSLEVNEIISEEVRVKHLFYSEDEKQKDLIQLISIFLADILEQLQLVKKIEEKLPLVFESYFEDNSE